LSDTSNMTMIFSYAKALSDFLDVEIKRMEVNPETGSFIFLE